MSILEDIQRSRSKRHVKYGYTSHCGHDHDDDDDCYRQKEQIIQFLKPHKKLIIIILIFAALLFLAILIALVVAIYPLLLSAVDYVNKNGIQGTVEAVLQFLQRIWQGNR